ncbi:MAG: TonB-dependent receptor, partial [Gluconacetobacter diazotrophicus]|nr:TonB-dependent receptor [Gluconacetobacter diazotrophicus]
YQPNGFNGFFTAALFHLRENDALAPDPDPTHLFASVQTGAIRSQGVELELHAFITRDLYVQGAYTYQDVSYVGGGNGALEGKRPTWDPAQFFSLRAHYAVQHGRLNGLGFGVGMRYEGNTVAYDSGDGPIYGTPSFALVDAEASYALGGLVPALRSAVLQVTAQNLLDTRTITSCYSLSFGCQFGAGRNVIGRLSYHW